MIERWHELLELQDDAKRWQRLRELFDDQAVFYSPVVHSPQRGKPLVCAYLGAAYSVLGPAGFHYVNEWRGSNSAALEFVANLDGIEINGVDLVHWNEADLITEFKVLIRPLQAIERIHELMKAMMSGEAAT